VFSGTVRIHLTVLEATKSIQCNANDLDIKSARAVVTHLKSETIQEPAISLVKETDLACFDFEVEIPSGASIVLVYGNSQ
jgi:hypothetical protein